MVVEIMDVVIFSITVTEWVSVPLVPVIESVELPMGVLPWVVTVRVELAPGAIEVGLNEGLAPLGRPLAERLTVPVNPFTAPTLTVYLILPPGVTVFVPGAAAKVKSGFATSRVTPVECTSEPLVPVIVKDAPPTGVDVVVVIVRVALAPAEIVEEGLNEGVAPVGRPLTDKLTVPVNPPSAAVETV